MKTSELERNLGIALIAVSTRYGYITLPMTFSVCVDVDSIVRDPTGKVIDATTLFTARWNSKHLDDPNWEDMIGNVEILHGINRFLRDLGIVGRVYWASMNAQYPEQFEFKFKPFMVDEFFPDLATRDDVERTVRRERAEAPRPNVVGRPQLRIVGRASA
jgi:hypothetical protein